MPETKARETAEIVDNAATKEELETAGFAAFFLMGA